MDPDYVRRMAESIRQATERGMFDQIRREIDSGLYANSSQVIDSGAYNTFQKIAEDIGQVWEQPTFVDQLKVIVEDLYPIGIANLPVGNTNIAEVALGNVNIAETAFAANVNPAKLIASDLFSVAEEARRNWLSDTSVQSSLQNALAGMDVDYFESLRRAMELTLDPKVREMVTHGVEVDQNEEFVEQLLHHHEHQESISEEASEDVSTGQINTAQTLSRIMFTLLFFQVALSGAHAVPNSEAYVATIREIVTSLIALCGYMLANSSQGRD